MACGYRSVDRDQLFLLPPDMRAWLPEDHWAWFVLDVVERIDTSVLHERHRNDGVGRRAYDPEMLLALLLYAYCTGQRSSRRIEQLCDVDVAYRVICANDPPDHTTIARFRQHHQEHAAALFVEVLLLLLCKEAGLTKVGVVAVDGTKIAADASLKANRTQEWLEAEVARMMAEADATDAAENEQFGDRRGDEMPAELARRESRRRRLDAAIEQLKAEQAKRDAERAEREAIEQQAVEAGRGFRGVAAVTSIRWLPPSDGLSTTSGVPSGIGPPSRLVPPPAGSALAGSRRASTAMSPGRCGVSTRPVPKRRQRPQRRRRQNRGSHRSRAGRTPPTRTVDRCRRRRRDGYRGSTLRQRPTRPVS